LAAILGRHVGIDDRQLRSVAYSPRRGVEPVRIVSIPQARGLALAFGVISMPDVRPRRATACRPPEVVIAQEVAEVVVVEDLLEDLRVVVHTSHDRLQNLPSNASRKFSMLLFCA